MLASQLTELRVAITKAKENHSKHYSEQQSVGNLVMRYHLYFWRCY